MAPGMVWTILAMPLMSWIVPRMLLACVQVTRRVRSESNSFRSSGYSFGFWRFLGIHHFRVKLLRSARLTQEATLASWSIPETISSSPGWTFKAYERLRKSWVVDGPMTSHG